MSGTLRVNDICNTKKRFTISFIECWRPIAGFHDKYYVSNYGRVLSGQKGRRRILSPCLDNYGYLGVNLYKHGKEVHRKVHRLVASIPNPHGLKVVNYKDKVRTDNRVSNLEWCTQKQNYHYGNCQLKNHLSLALNDAKHADLELLCEHDRTIISKAMGMISRLACLKYRD